MRLSRHGFAFYSVLLSHTDGLGYSDDMLENFGISSERYPEIVNECISAFSHATLIKESYSAVCREVPHALRADKDSIDGVVFDQELRAVRDIFTFAQSHLNDRGFFIYVMHNLVDAEHKMSFPDIACEMNISNSQAAHLYKSAFTIIRKNLGPKINPYLTPNNLRPYSRYEVINRQLGRELVAPDTLTLDDASSIKLYMISSTLFDMCNHVIACNFLFKPPKDRLSTADLSKTIILSEDRMMHIRLPGLIQMIRRAAMLENDGGRLTNRLDKLLQDTHPDQEQSLTL